ncbi:putative tRNA synthetase [Toxoplasma gondii TgCatPRC2]|uniref:valine--tRNA ligase n=1 Tax=Toxoplasma gondii TgCatPRC2 TaxID=1130821 RepID=A0A151H4V8_TOXGO|nr:putative tRNA synthetase [Toxoplasma gondii TgCatPRC2]
MTLCRRFSWSILYVFLTAHFFLFVPSAFLAEGVRKPSCWSRQASPGGYLSLAAIDGAGDFAFSRARFASTRSETRRKPRWKLANKTNPYDTARHKWHTWTSPSGAYAESGSGVSRLAEGCAGSASLCSFVLCEENIEKSAQERDGLSCESLKSSKERQKVSRYWQQPRAQGPKCRPPGNRTRGNICHGWVARIRGEAGLDYSLCFNSILPTSSFLFLPAPVFSKTRGHHQRQPQASRTVRVNSVQPIVTEEGKACDSSLLPVQSKNCDKRASSLTQVSLGSTASWTIPSTDTAGAFPPSRIPVVAYQTCLEKRIARGKYPLNGVRREICRPATLLRSSSPCARDRPEQQKWKERSATGLPRAFPHHIWERCLYTWWEATLGVFDADKAAASVLADRTVPSRPLLAGRRDEKANAPLSARRENASVWTSAKLEDPGRCTLPPTANRVDHCDCEMLRRRHPGNWNASVDSETPRGPLPSGSDLKDAERSRGREQMRQSAEEWSVSSRREADEPSGCSGVWTSQQSGNDEDGEPPTRFRLLMPPPNLTGPLHLGHAASLALQELLVRHKRMLLLPGGSRGAGDILDRANACGGEAEEAQDRGENSDSREQEARSVTEATEKRQAGNLETDESKFPSPHKTQIGTCFEQTKAEPFRPAGPGSKDCDGERGKQIENDADLRGKNRRCRTGNGLLTACRTEWIPGTDHAGLAMTWLLRRHEVRIRERRKQSKDELGRADGERKQHESALLSRWVSICRYVIERQQRRLGCSCDWSRRVYTLDGPYCDLVTRAFVQLFRQKYIRKGTYLTLWDCGAQTALADFEVFFPSLDDLRQAEKNVLEGMQARGSTVSREQTPHAVLNEDGVRGVEAKERSLEAAPGATDSCRDISGGLREARLVDTPGRETQEETGDQATPEGEGRRFYFLSCRILPVSSKNRSSSSPQETVVEFAPSKGQAQEALPENTEGERNEVDGDGRREQDGETARSDIRVAICLEDPRQLTQIAAICVKPQTFRRICSPSEKSSASQVSATSFHSSTFPLACFSSWEVELPGVKRSVPLLVHDGEHLHPLACAAGTRLRQLRGLHSSSPSAASPSSRSSAVSPNRPGNRVDSECRLSSSEGPARALDSLEQEPRAAARAELLQAAKGPGTGSKGTPRDSEREAALQTNFVGLAVFSETETCTPSLPLSRGPKGTQLQVSPVGVSGEDAEDPLGAPAPESPAFSTARASSSAPRQPTGVFAQERKSLWEAIAREGSSLGVWEEHTGANEGAAASNSAALPGQWPRWISTRTGAEVQLRLSSQWLLDLPALAREAQKVTKKPQRTFSLQGISGREHSREAGIATTETIRGGQAASPSQRRPSTFASGRIPPPVFEQETRDSCDSPLKNDSPESSDRGAGDAFKGSQFRASEASLEKACWPRCFPGERGNRPTGRTNEEEERVAKEREGENSAGLQLLPGRFERQWNRMARGDGGLRPWCLSRQLTWGVPLPVWRVRFSGRARQKEGEKGDEEDACEWDEVAASEEEMWISVEANLTSRLQDFGFDRPKERATAILRRARMQGTSEAEKERNVRDGNSQNEVRRETERLSEPELQLTVTKSRDVLDTWFSSALWPLACSQVAEEDPRREAKNAHTDAGPSSSPCFLPPASSPTSLPASSSSSSSSPSSSPSSSSSSSSSSSPSSSSLSASGISPCWRLPQTELVTGEDILFFWVVRQFVLCAALTQQAPFSRVTLHGLLVDREGKKLSKTKGNVERGYLDRLIDEAGADALRWTFLSGMSPGASVAFDEGALASSRRFLHKLWHAGRFIERFASQFPPPAPSLRAEREETTDTSEKEREEKEFESSSPTSMKNNGEEFPCPQGVSRKSVLKRRCEVEIDRLSGGASASGDEYRRNELSPLVARYYWSRSLQVAKEVTELLKKMEAGAAAHALQNFFWCDAAAWLLPAAAAVRAEAASAGLSGTGKEGEREHRKGEDAGGRRPREGERAEAGSREDGDGEEKENEEGENEEGEWEEETKGEGAEENEEGKKGDKQEAVVGGAEEVGASGHSTRRKSFFLEGRRTNWTELERKCRPAAEDQLGLWSDLLLSVFDVTLRLLHPFVPFITEALFQSVIVPFRLPKDDRTSNASASSSSASSSSSTPSCSSASFASFPDAFASSSRALMASRWPLHASETPDLDTEALRLFPVLQGAVRRLRRALKEAPAILPKTRRQEGGTETERFGAKAEAREKGGNEAGPGVVESDRRMQAAADTACGDEEIDEAEREGKGEGTRGTEGYLGRDSEAGQRTGRRGHAATARVPAGAPAKGDEGEEERRKDEVEEEERRADAADRKARPTDKSMHVEIRVKNGTLFTLLKRERFFVAAWAGLDPVALSVVYEPRSSGSRATSRRRSEELAETGRSEKNTETTEELEKSDEADELEASVREMEIVISHASPSASDSHLSSPASETLRGESGASRDVDARKVQAGAKVEKVGGREEKDGVPSDEFPDADARQEAQQGGEGDMAGSRRAAHHGGKRQRLRRQIEELEARLAVPEFSVRAPREVQRKLLARLERTRHELAEIEK